MVVKNNWTRCADIPVSFLQLWESACFSECLSPSTFWNKLFFLKNLEKISLSSVLIFWYLFDYIKILRCRVRVHSPEWDNFGSYWITNSVFFLWDNKEIIFTNLDINSWNFSAFISDSLHLSIPTQGLPNGEAALQHPGFPGIQTAYPGVGKLNLHHWIFF